MKVWLDLDQLLAAGEITPEQHTRLTQLGKSPQSQTLVNIAIAFGVIATAAGALTWVQSIELALFLGYGLTGLGIYLRRRSQETWHLLGIMLLLVGALMAAIATVIHFEGGIGFVIATALFFLTAILAQSHLMAICGTLSLASLSGTATGYWFSSYYLIVEQPTISIVCFGLLAALIYGLRKWILEQWQALSVTVARTSLLMVNFAFWVGSLWGDHLWREPRGSWWNFGWSSSPVIPGWGFGIIWAIALVALMIWSQRQNQLWILYLSLVFFTIHFYTQYFERFQFSPLSLLFGGLLALSGAFGWR
ncbi:MAG: hypothetical protein AAGG02_03655, partial [Cyanobacteria bacterium P01_H01_bin.15]